MMADELYEQAKAIVIKQGKPSESLLQRELNIGYARARALIQQMDKDGLVHFGATGWKILHHEEHEEHEDFKR